MEKISKIALFTDIERGFLAGVIGALPGVALNATFIDVLEASKFAIIFWLMIGIAVGVLRATKNEKSS